MTGSPEADPDTPATPNPRPGRGRPALVAVGAVVAVVGLTAGIAAAVNGLNDDPAAPLAAPPGADDAAARIDTVPAAREGEGPSATPRTADERHSPNSAPPATARPREEWLDAVSSATGLPRRALYGYAVAQLRLREERPGCRISWPTLAGIGQVESHQGTLSGGRVGDDGRTTVEIIGVPLNGENGTARIPDTDRGELDDDTTWDRAVGPMQFIPATWDRWGVDADNDGTADPHDIDDAALAAGRYLCADGRDLTRDDGWWSAVLSYNESESYARDVLDHATRFAAKAE